MNAARFLAAGCLVVLAAAARGRASTLLVLNKEGTVAMVDPVSLKVLGKAPTGEGPHEVVAAAEGKLAIVSNYGTARTPGHTLSVIDIASRREIHRVDVSPLERPHGLFSADGKVYFTAEVNQAIARYDPVANRVDWKLGTGQDGTHMIALSRDRNLIFTSNIESDTISIFAKQGNHWKPTSVHVGHAPEGFDVSPDGMRLWAANSADGTVSIVDVPARKVVETFHVGVATSNRLKFTPDGKRALISDLATGDLAVIDVPSRKVIKRLNLGRSIAGILVAPDGSRAYVAATDDNYVSVVDLKTLAELARIATGNGPDGMDWIEKP